MVSGPVRQVPPSDAHSAGAAPAFRVRRIGIALALFEPNPSFLVEQLASIVRQTWTAWTCVVTADSPLDALRNDSRLMPFLTDARFQWCENPRRLGYLPNFERAVQQCAAAHVDAIACCDQDDIWEVEKLAVLAAALEKAGPLALVHSDLSLLSADGRTRLADSVWALEQRGIAQVSPEHLLVRNVVSGCAMLFDAELARRMPTIPEAAQYHDRWYALLAACHGGVHGVSRPLVRYRRHRAQVVGMRAGLTLPTIVPALLAWVRETDLTIWMRNTAQAWRSYLVLCDVVTQYRLLPSRPQSGWRVLLLGLQWFWRDLTLSVNAWILALGSVLVLVIPAAPEPDSQRAVAL